MSETIPKKKENPPLNYIVKHTGLNRKQRMAMVSLKRRGKVKDVPHR